MAATLVAAAPMQIHFALIAKKIVSSLPLMSNAKMTPPRMSSISPGW